MQAKAAMRAAALKRRAVLSAAERAAAGDAIAHALRDVLAGAVRVAAYVSIGSEPSTAAALPLCRQLVLPVLMADGDLDWGTGPEVAPTAHRLLEPTGPHLGLQAIAECDVVLVPALAVDAAGNRLGRGGGSYDRALRRTSGLTIALLYDGEQVASVPTEPHDTRVGAVVTPAGLTLLG